MLEFFKPWRRRFGVVTLGLACVFAAGWVRSYAKFDLVFLPRVCIVSSANGEFAISENVRLRSRLAGGGAAIFTLESTAFLSRPKLASYDLARTTVLQPRMIRYSFVVIPLTLISAWLLLSNPRSKHHVNSQVQSSP